MDIHKKQDLLINDIQQMGKAAVAFSGGVDSSFLSKVCFDTLKNNAIAITLVSPMNPKSEIDESVKIAGFIGIPQVMIIDDKIDKEVSENPIDRCYYCKRIEFSRIIEKAEGLGFKFILDGSNLDDLSDYRPGMKALQELNIQSPLRKAGLTKKDIRELSKESGLWTWDKPAKACLASRIPYGQEITREKLKQIENAEEILSGKGFKQFRVRTHDNIARIELAADEREKIFNIKLMDELSNKIKTLGFLYVSLELEGYQSGSMNKVIKG